jgi:uncharacterized membrane protein
MEPGTAGEASGMIRHVRAWPALSIEALAVGVIVVEVRQATVDERETHHLGKAMWLGLVWLVVTDVVRTVTLEPTLHIVAVFCLLVFICTFLCGSLVVEIEGRWPRQGASEHGGKGAQEV